MATRKNNAPAVAQSVDASPDIQRTIAEAIELVETTQRALEPNEQRASEYGALGQAVAKLWAAHNQVELLPSGTSAPVESAPDGFDDLLGRMLNVIGHFQCADRVLFDMQEVPEQLQPAAVVLHDATEVLRRLYDELDTWGMHRRRNQAEAGGAR
jgi:DNA repair ATPase RecN